MAELLTNIVVQDNYSNAASLGPTLGITQLVFQVFNEPVYARFYKPPVDVDSNRQPTLDPTEHYFPVGTLLSVDGAAGVQFRNALAGQPATVNAQIAFAGDPLFDFQSSGLFSAAVLTLEFLHNNALVGAESVLDFEDSPTIVWSVVDTPATKVAATASLTFGTVTSGTFVFSDPLSTGPLNNVIGGATTGTFLDSTGLTRSTVAASATEGYSLAVAADSFERVQLNSSPALRFGSGAAATDTVLNRQSAGIFGSAGGGFSAGGLTGATAGSRYVGATTGGAPGSGTFVVGDFVIDRTGAVWVCTVAGSPGTWANAGSSGNLVTSVFTRTGAVVATTGDYTAAQVTNAADKSSASPQIFTGTVSEGPTGFSLPSSTAGAYLQGSLIGTQAAAATNVFLIARSNGTDTIGVFVITSDGSFSWGSGTAARDVTLSRSSVGNLTLGGSSGGLFAGASIVSAMGGDGASPLFNAVGAAAGAALNSGGVVQVSRATNNAAITVTNPGATTDWRWALTSDGVMRWAAANTAFDVQLGRVVNLPTGTGSFLELTAGAGFGYGVGTGGVIASIVSGSSGTLNKPSGKFTGSAAIATGAFGTYTVSNTCVGADDLIIVNLVSGGGNIQRALVTAVAAGSFTVLYENASGVNQTPTINFCVIKGAQS